MIANGESGSSGIEPWTDWRSVVQGFRLIARNDAKARLLEAELLRAAEHLRVWIEVGCVSLVQLLERELGLGPKVARDRIRVARALVELPAITAALAAGELTYSAVRELTRVATTETELDWVAAVRGKVLRDIERKVANRARGSRPTDPIDPDLRLRVLRFEVTPATNARQREARAKLESERGERLDEDQVMEAFATAVLDGAAVHTQGARYQLAITQCETCKQAWQVSGGVQAPITEAMLERATCDAVRIGSLDTNTPARAVQDVSPAVRRLVEQRDAGACRVPGCRSARFLEVHHIVFRAHGGSHSANNLLLICGSHHAALHDGKLTISGTAPDHLVFTRHDDACDARLLDSVRDVERGLDAFLHGSPFVPTDGGHAASSIIEPIDAAVTADAVLALVTLGFTRSEAKLAVDAARRRLGPNPSLEAVVVESLRQLAPTRS